MRPAASAATLARRTILAGRCCPGGIVVDPSRRRLVLLPSGGPCRRRSLDDFVVVRPTSHRSGTTGMRRHYVAIPVVYVGCRWLMTTPVHTEKKEEETTPSKKTRMVACPVCLGEGLVRRDRLRDDDRNRRPSRRERKRARRRLLLEATKMTSGRSSASDLSHSSCPDDLSSGDDDGDDASRGRARERLRRRRWMEDWSVLSHDDRKMVPVRPCPACDRTGLVPRRSPHDEGDERADDNTTLDEDGGGGGSGKNRRRPGQSSQRRRHPHYFHVSIIGGGIGGSALALALSQRDVPCTLYESDGGMDVRAQGYGLTMQQGSKYIGKYRRTIPPVISGRWGFRALGCLGLVEPSTVEDMGYGMGVKSTRHVVCRSDGEIVCEWGKRAWGRDNTVNGTGDGRVERTGESRDGPCGRERRRGKSGTKKPKRFNVHIPRQELRRLLLDEVPPDVVRWGHRLVSYTDGGRGVVDGDDNGDAYADEEDGTLRRIRGMTFYVSGANDDGEKHHEQGPLLDGDDGVESNLEVPRDAGREVAPNAINVLVGADGIWSRVRALKFDKRGGGVGVGGGGSNDVGEGGDPAPLRSLDCMVILGIAPTPSTTTPDAIATPGSPLDLLDGETVFETVDGTTRLYAMPFSSSSSSPRGPEEQDSPDGPVLDSTTTMWQLSFPMSERDATELSSRGATAMMDEALSRCGDWHDPVPALLRKTSPDLVTGYPVYDREVVVPPSIEEEDDEGGRDGSRTRSSHGSDDVVGPRRRSPSPPPPPAVTLLGDAAHPMSPFKGQGANQALLDAVLLARVLRRASGEIDVVIAEEERERAEERRRRRQGRTSCLEDVGGEGEEEEETSSIAHDILARALKWYESEMLRRAAPKVRASSDAARFLHSVVATTDGNMTRPSAFRRLKKEKEGGG